MVERVVVVDEACLFRHPAAGGVGGGMAAGQPAAVRAGEPVRHDGAESLGGEAFVPPLPADAVARLPDAVGQVQPRPLSLLLRLPRQGIVQADGAEPLSGCLFHHGHW